MSRITPGVPQFLALIPCERTSKNEETGQWNIHGTFEQMHLETYPALVPQFDVYVAVGKGSSSKLKETVNLALISPAGQIIMQTLILIDWNTGPIAELGQTLHAVIFRTTGDYTLRLFVDDHILVERTITMGQQ
jgi:hypothetical protein